MKYSKISNDKYLVIANNNKIAGTLYKLETATRTVWDLYDNDDNYLGEGRSKNMAIENVSEKNDAFYQLVSANA